MMYPKSRSGWVSCLASFACLAMLVLCGSAIAAEPTLAQPQLEALPTLAPVFVAQAPEASGVAAPDSEVRNQSPPDYSPPTSPPASTTAPAVTTQSTETTTVTSTNVTEGIFYTTGPVVTSSRARAHTYVTKTPRQRRRSKVKMVTPVVSTVPVVSTGPVMTSVPIMTSVAPVQSYSYQYATQAICPTCGRGL